MADIGKVRLFEIGSGDTGKVYRRVSIDDPDNHDNTVIKHPVSEQEVECAKLWAAKNHKKQYNYSAGPIAMVLFTVRRKEVAGMQMTYLGDTTFEDCSYTLCVGENILLYLMLVHCTLRLAEIIIQDTAWHNCMCRGREQEFRIYLVDTAEWEISKTKFNFIHNFNHICDCFQLKINLALEKITSFLTTEFTCEKTFLEAMLESCEVLSEHFLHSHDEDKCIEVECDEDERFEDTSVHYQERIHDLLDVIRSETQEALMHF